MAYDQILAQRIRAALPGIPGIIEKKMFGGIAFMIDGNMACAISKDNLMLRISRDDIDAALAQPYVRISDMGGRPMKGWLLIEPAGLQSDDSLKRWIEQAVAFVQSLPAK
jgi:TfoX/Sxy family transcriptional regulator of competence genes